jgi:Glycosyltransferase family 87
LRTRRPPGLVILYGALLVVATTILIWAVTQTLAGVTTPPGPFVDWRTYINAAVRLRAGESIYAIQQLSGPYRLTDVLLIGYAYPPASAPIFLAFESYPLGLAGWITLNLGMLLTALWAMVSKAWPRRRVLAYSLILVGLAFYPPFLDGMLWMNANVGLAGAIGWVSIGLTGTSAGVVGGLGAVIKVFAGALTFATPGGKVKAIVIAGGIALAICVVTLPIVGPQSWADFVTALASATPDCTGLNMSIACHLEPWVDLRVGTIAGVAIGGVAAIGLLASRSPYWMTVFAAIAVMAPANNLHLHYWTILFVLLVATAARVSAVFTMKREARDSSREDQSSFALTDASRVLGPIKPN